MTRIAICLLLILAASPAHSWRLLSDERGHTIVKGAHIGSVPDVMIGVGCVDAPNKQPLRVIAAGWDIFHSGKAIGAIRVDDDIISVSTFRLDPSNRGLISDHLSKRQLAFFLSGLEVEIFVPSSRHHSEPHWAKFSLIGFTMAISQLRENCFFPR